MLEPDLTVVGAGTIGALVVDQARRAHPEWQILLADRSLVGHATSAFSPGHNHPHGLDGVQRRYAAESIEYYQRLSQELPGLPLHERPMFALVSAERLEATLAGYVRPGMRPASAAERAQLLSWYPGLQIAPQQEVITGARGGYGSPPGIVARVVRRFAAGERSAVFEGAELEAIAARDDRVRLAFADGRVVHSARAVIATGPLACTVAPALPIVARLRLKKVVAMHLDVAPTEDHPILYLFDDDAYLLPTVERRQIVFSFPSREWDCSPEPTQLRISREDRAVALGILERYLPALAASCSGGRVSCDAYTADRLPLIAALPALSRTVFAGGGSGYGFRLAPAIAGRALAILSSAHEL